MLTYFEYCLAVWLFAFESNLKFLDKGTQSNKIFAFNIKANIQNHRLISSLSNIFEKLFPLLTTHYIICFLTILYQVEKLKILSVLNEVSFFFLILYFNIVQLFFLGIGYTMEHTSK